MIPLKFQRYFYGTILACSYINWGEFITSQSMKRNDFDVKYHTTEINFNEKYMVRYAEEKNDGALKKQIISKVNEHKPQTFLSKILYYQILKK